VLSVDIVVRCVARTGGGGQQARQKSKGLSFRPNQHGKQVSYEFSWRASQGTVKLERGVWIFQPGEKITKFIFVGNR